MSNPTAEYLQTRAKPARPGMEGNYLQDAFTFFAVFLSYWGESVDLMKPSSEFHKTGT